MCLVDAKALLDEDGELLMIWLLAGLPG